MGPTDESLRLGSLLKKISEYSQTFIRESPFEKPKLSVSQKISHVESLLSVRFITEFLPKEDISVC